MARSTISVEGLRELDRALGEMSKATAKNVLRRALRKAAEPIATAARAAAPVDDGQLRNSIGVGTRLTRRQQAQHRRATRAAGKSFVEVFVGAGGLPQAHLREFGGDGAPPQPFMRPAWDSGKAGVLATLKFEIAAGVEKAAQRAARKAARLARAGG